VAFDICGCNQVLNHFANRLDKEYDDKGNLANEGVLDLDLFSFLEKHPYYDLPYPKSLDNQYVYNEFIYPIPDVIPDQDVLHTYCNFIAKQIFNACKKLGVNDEEVFITGGGAHNNFLISRIQNYLTPLNISLKIPSDEVVNFKESLLMAYMGYLFLQDRPNVLAESTGAKEGWVSGSLYKGKR
jgi:anhydro-N-acetylmuramic acid kinase